MAGHPSCPPRLHLQAVIYPSRIWNWPENNLLKSKLKSTCFRYGADMDNVRPEEKPSGPKTHVICLPYPTISSLFYCCQLCLHNVIVVASSNNMYLVSCLKKRYIVTLSNYIYQCKLCFLFGFLLAWLDSQWPIWELPAGSSRIGWQEKMWREGGQNKRTLGPNCCGIFFFFFLKKRTIHWRSFFDPMGSGRWDTTCSPFSSAPSLHSLCTLIPAYPTRSGQTCPKKLNPDGSI